MNIPKEINAYSIKNEIAKSALGGVYTAINEYTEEKVAIKIIDKERLQCNKLELALINNEITILKLLNHKNIIKLYEVFESKDFIYIVTELCEGKDMFDYICNKKTLPELEALNIFHQIVDAMIYIHDMNIVHRDIKPENVLFDSKGNVKIIDFGCSCYYSNSDTLLNEDIGTPSYACPEMHKGIWYRPEQADVWSCGVLLFIMVCGYHPFSEEDEDKNEVLIESGDYNIPDTISPLLKDLITHMMDPNPSTRYHFKDVLTSDWFNSNQALPDLIGGVNYFEMKFPIDRRILNICECYGFDKDFVRASIENNKYNNASAVYRQCVKQVVNAGMTSISDLQSDEFKEYINNSDNWISREEVGRKKREFDIKEYNRRRKQKEQEDLMNSNEEKALKILDETNSEYIRYKASIKANPIETPTTPKKESKDTLESVSVDSREAISLSPKDTTKTIMSEFDSFNKDKNVLLLLHQRFRRNTVSQLDLKKEDYLKKANPRRRNAIIKRKEIEEAVQLYRSNMNQIEESDNESIDDIKSIDSNKEENNEERKEKEINEMVDKEKERQEKEEKERLRLIEEQKKQFEIDNKEKLIEEEKEKIRKEEERKEQIKRRLQMQLKELTKKKTMEEQANTKDKFRNSLLPPKKNPIIRRKSSIEDKLKFREKLQKEIDERERLRKEALEKERLRLEEEERIKKELKEKERIRRENEEKERVIKEEKERLKREEEEKERIKKVEEERLKREREEKLKREKEEEERLKREREERLKKDEEERLRREKEEEERQKKEEEEKEIQRLLEEKLREETEKKRKEEERIRIENERKAKEELIRIENEKKEEEERMRIEKERKEEEERMRIENERKREEERIRIEKIEQERLTKEKEENERKRKQEEELKLNKKKEEAKKALDLNIKEDEERLNNDINNDLFLADDNSFIFNQDSIEVLDNDTIEEEKDQSAIESTIIKEEPKVSKDKLLEEEEKKRKESEYKKRIKKIKEEKERIRKIREDQERIKREKEESSKRQANLKARLKQEQEKKEREALKLDLQKKLNEKRRQSKRNSLTKQICSNLKKDNKTVKKLTFNIDDDSSPSKRIGNPLFTNYNNNSLSNRQRSSISNIKSQMITDLNLSTNKNKSTENVIPSDIIDTEGYQSIRKECHSVSVSCERHSKTNRSLDEDELFSYLSARYYETNGKSSTIKDVKAKIRPLKIRKEHSFDSSCRASGSTTRRYKKSSTKSLNTSNDSFTMKRFNSTNRSINQSSDRIRREYKTPYKANSLDHSVIKEIPYKNNIIKKDSSNTKHRSKKMNKYSSATKIPLKLTLAEDVIFKKVPISTNKKTIKKHSPTKINIKLPQQKKRAHHLKILSLSDNVYAKISSFQTNKQNREESPKEYTGIIDIQCISLHNSKESINRIISKLRSKNIFYLQVSSFKLRCSKHQTIFDIELCSISSGIFYYMIKTKENANMNIVSSLFN